MIGPLNIVAKTIQFGNSFSTITEHKKSSCIFSRRGISVNSLYQEPQSLVCPGSWTLKMHLDLGRWPKPSWAEGSSLLWVWKFCRHGTGQGNVLEQQKSVWHLSLAYMATHSLGKVTFSALLKMLSKMPSMTRKMKKKSRLCCSSQWLRSVLRRLCDMHDLRPEEQQTSLEPLRFAQYFLRLLIGPGSAYQ